MALTTEEQKFYDFAKASLPDWIPDADEFLMGAAKMFGSVKTLIDYLFGQALISTAEGATGSTPDWLNQHAADRGTRRQLSEGDPTLRERLRNVPDALTRQSILDACNLILAANGLPEEAAMVELNRDAAHAGTYDADDGAIPGVLFVGLGVDGVQMIADQPWARAPYRDPSVIRRVQSFQITITNATNPGNNGTFAIIALDDFYVVCTNPTAVGIGDGAAEWSISQLDRRGNVLSGRGRAFASRGFRAAGSRPTIVIMLPYGTTEGIVASVREMLRQKKAAGVRALVERRLNP